jgi:hypothetical protein
MFEEFRYTGIAFALTGANTNVKRITTRVEVAFAILYVPFMRVNVSVGSRLQFNIQPSSVVGD